MSVYGHRDEIVKVINRGKWQYTMHLPKKNGRIDWMSQETREECIRLLAEAKAEGETLARKADALLKAI